MSKDFELGDVLSITTGRLLSRRRMDGVYEILNYMTDDNLFTHQLPRAGDECKPVLLAHYPQLAEIEVPEFENQDAMWRWLDEQETKYGKNLPVEPVAEGDHEFIHPIEELADMVGPERIIVADPTDLEGAVEEIQKLIGNNN